MNKLLIGAAIAATVAIPVAVAPAVAGATGGGGSPNQVTIDERADFDFVGTNIDVGLRVRCAGGSGTVSVQVFQYPPETASPVASSIGTQPVVCDGQTHTVGVTTVGVGFDEGRAKATASLTTAAMGSASAERWITIVAV